MTTKAIRPNPRPAAMPSIEGDELRQADVDNFIARNRDELNASIQRSRAEMADGLQSTRSIEDIIADGRKRHGSRS